MTLPVAAIHATLERSGNFKHMPLHPDSVMDSLARMSRVIQNDRSLRECFARLANLSEVERRNKIYLAAEQIRAEEKDADWAASFQVLADARVFEATRLAVTEFPAPKCL